MGILYPPCEVVTKYLLPIFRSMVAKELVEKYNFTQVAAAERLGTTQAAISQYIHSKRGYKGIKQFKDILPDIQSAASETAKGIATGKIRTDEIMLRFCKLCTTLREQRKIIT